MNSCKRLILAKVFVQGYYPTLDFKGAFSSLRQFLATESPLKIMIYFFFYNFTLKSLLVLKKFKFLSSTFGYVEKLLHLKDKVNFEIYDVTTWLANNCNTHIGQYLKE